MSFITKLYEATTKFNILLDKSLSSAEKMERLYVYASKTLGVTSGGALLGKGAFDLTEAIICKDGICAIVSFIGCAADTLQLITTFVPGGNATTLATLPISLGCKTFVQSCKSSKFFFKC
jgi:hypothetical protein